MENPEVLRIAQQEVDNVIRAGPINVDHLSKLPYITACLRETLRLTPTVTGSEVAPLPNTTDTPVLIGGGKYMVKPNQSIFYILKKIHTDPAVYGKDAKSFRPERMLDENFNKLPTNSWKVMNIRARRFIEILLTQTLYSPSAMARDPASAVTLRGKRQSWPQQCCFKCLISTSTILAINCRSKRL